MRKISSKTISNALKKLCLDAVQEINPEIFNLLKESLKKEKNKTAQGILDELVRNARAAHGDNIPLCQDTGFAVVFLKIGQRVAIDGDLNDAVNAGIISAYQYLRKSVVSHPFTRKNTHDNTPAIIHVEMVPGEKITIGFLPKGGGAENCSFQKMFLPTTTREEITEYIISNIKDKAARACPPIIVGIGIGGTFDYSTFLAKKALTRKVGRSSSDQKMAAYEAELLKRINKLGIGPMGLGGNTTALAVHIEPYPCHIASLPVAVNIECHSHRYREVTI